MAKGKFIKGLFDVITQVQQENKANPKEETVDGKVFDVIKQQIAKIEQKKRDKRAAQGKDPRSFLDLVRNGIDKAQKKNVDDPNVKTAPQDIFNRIKERIEERPRRRAQKGIQRIVQEYNLDVSRLSPQVLQQIQDQYKKDRDGLKQQYAKAINDLIQQQS